MELTPTIVIALIALAVTLLGVFAGIVAGFVRIESRTNSHTEDIKELFRHSENDRIHHPADELDRRFSVVDRAASEIKAEIVKLGERIDRFLTSK